MDVFLTSPWIPAEWIRAHGLQPRGIGSVENFAPGAWPLSAGVCAFAEAAVRFAGARPDSAVIFSTACDQLRRGFDTAVLHGQPRAFLFNLPATWQTLAAGQIFRSELEVPPVCDAMTPTLGSRLQALVETAQARRTQ